MGHPRWRQWTWESHAERVVHDVTTWLEFNGQLMSPRTVEQILKVTAKIEKKLLQGDRYAIRSALK